MHTAMWVSLGYVGYCVAIGAAWHGLVSLARRGGRS